MSLSADPRPLKFTGARHLPSRLILATLTGRSIKVSDIRSNSHTTHGLLAHEISLLRLLESITNGSHIEFSVTGTTLLYKPGLIIGSGPGSSASNGVVRHELPAENARGVSYFLLPLCLLAPFAKGPLTVLFAGPGCITSATPRGDLSVDTVRTAILPTLAPFGIQAGIELRVLQRSNPGPGGKGGGGQVQLVFGAGSQVRLPKTLHLLNPGRIKRVRGVAYATGVGGSNNARSISTARSVLNTLVADCYIFSDVSSAPPGQQGRKIGIGFGISLVAESSTGCVYSSDVGSPPEGGVTPEDIGKRAAWQLLENIGIGGCVQPAAAKVVLTLMAMGSEDVGRIRMGRDVLATEEVIQLGRDLRAFGASGWGLKDADDEEGEGDVVVSVVGRGVGNVGRKIA